MNFIKQLFQVKNHYITQNMICYINGCLYTGCHYASQASFWLLIILPQSPKWYYKHVALWHVFLTFKDRGYWYTSKASLRPSLNSWTSYYRGFGIFICILARQCLIMLPGTALNSQLNQSSFFQSAEWLWPQQTWPFSVF